MFYALAGSKPSLRKYLSESINLFVALAPVTRFDHSGSTLNQLLIPFADKIAYVLDFFGIYEVGNSMRILGASICTINGPLCQWAEGFMTTSDPSYDDPDRFQIYMGHSFAGTNLKSNFHYAQIFNSKKF